MADIGLMERVLTGDSIINPNTYGRMSTAEKTTIMDQGNAAGITLNGKPASIAGRRLSFAIIYQIDGGLSYEFSWDTVRHILEDHGGQFFGA